MLAGDEQIAKEIVESSAGRKPGATAFTQCRECCFLALLQIFFAPQRRRGFTRPKGCLCSGGDFFSCAISSATGTRYGMAECGVGGVRIEQGRAPGAG